MKNLLLDTHALVFWSLGQHLSERFAALLDRQNRAGRLLVSAVSFWEVALLARKGRIAIDDVAAWKEELRQYAGIRIVVPDADDMIRSAALPPHHKDPMDRLLVAQAMALGAVLVTRDAILERYGIKTLWRE